METLFQAFTALTIIFTIGAAVFGWYSHHRDWAIIASWVAVLMAVSTFFSWFLTMEWKREDQARIPIVEATSKEESKPIQSAPIISDPRQGPWLKVSMMEVQRNPHKKPKPGEMKLRLAYTVENLSDSPANNFRANWSFVTMDGPMPSMVYTFRNHGGTQSIMPHESKLMTWECTDQFSEQNFVLPLLYDDIMAGKLLCIGTLTYTDVSGRKFQFDISVYKRGELWTTMNEKLTSPFDK